MVMTYGDAYRRVKQMLSEEEGPQAAATARELLSFVSEKSIAELMAMDAEPVPQTVLETYLHAAERILRSEPLAYVLGKWSFFGMELTVSPDVLIPRDDTMAVVELALEKAKEQDCSLRILDLCTGSGCIGLALASKLPKAQIVMGDISREALQIAEKNREALGLTEAVRCMVIDALQPASEKLGVFDMIVSNPPYITAEEMRSLQKSVLDYEPHTALYGGEDGLDFYRAIIDNFSSALCVGGYLCFEFGLGQESAISRLLEEKGYAVLQLRKDYSGIVRAIIAQKKERHNANGNG